MRIFLLLAFVVLALLQELSKPLLYKTGTLYFPTRSRTTTHHACVVRSVRTLLLAL